MRTMPGNRRSDFTDRASEIRSIDDATYVIAVFVLGERAIPKSL
jgi:hypothetical protein